MANHVYIDISKRFVRGELWQRRYCGNLSGRISQHGKCEVLVGPVSIFCKRGAYNHSYQILENSQLIYSCKVCEIVRKKTEGVGGPVLKPGRNVQARVG